MPKKPFLLTHPVWDVTLGNALGNGFMIFLLTHPVWDVTYFLRLATFST